MLSFDGARLWAPWVLTWEAQSSVDSEKLPQAWVTSLALLQPGHGGYGKC